MLAFVPIKFHRWQTKLITEKKYYAFPITLQTISRLVFLFYLRTLKRNKDIFYTKETLKDTVTADVQVHMTRGQMFSFFKEIQLK